MRIWRLLYIGVLVHCIVKTVRYIRRRFNAERDTRAAYTAMRFYVVIQYSVSFWYTGKTLKIDTVGRYQTSSNEIRNRARKLMMEYIENYVRDHAMSPVGWHVRLVDIKPVGTKAIDDLYKDKDDIAFIKWLDTVQDAVVNLAK
jgi:hypothetical protein